MDNGYTTGITPLDRQLDGGVPPGSIILFTAPPASQSEQFLYKFSTPRDTLYSTTIRSTESVRDAAFRSPIQLGEEPKIEDHSDSPINEVKDALRRLEPESTLIVDTIDPLEYNDRDDYLYFLNDVQNELQNTNSIVIFHAIKGESKSENRDVSKQMADVVFDLTQFIDGEELVTRLTIPKYRGGSIPEESIKLNLTDGITIDMSRDIA